MNCLCILLLLLIAMIHVKDACIRNGHERNLHDILPNGCKNINESCSDSYECCSGYHCAQNTNTCSEVKCLGGGDLCADTEDCCKDLICLGHVCI